MFLHCTNYIRKIITSGFLRCRLKVDSSAPTRHVTLYPRAQQAGQGVPGHHRVRHVMCVHCRAAPLCTDWWGCYQTNHGDTPGVKVEIRSYLRRNLLPPTYLVKEDNNKINLVTYLHQYRRCFIHLDDGLIWNCHFDRGCSKLLSSHLCVEASALKILRILPDSGMG